MQKNIKFLLKLLFVIIFPIIALIYYILNIGKILNESIIVIILATSPLLLVFFNVVFYSFHMSNTKLFGRWSTTIFQGLGLLLAIDDDDKTLVFIIGCFGITFTYSNLFKKTGNLKPENKF